MNPLKIRLVIAALAAVLLSTGIQAQETYRIQLDRPLNVGDRYSFSTLYDARQVMNISTGGNEVQKVDSAFTVTMEADVEVTEAKGMVQKVTVRRCVKVAEGDSTELVPAGTQFMYRRHSDGSSLTPVTASIDEETLSIIDDAFPGSIHRPDNASVGTSKAQKVGGTWKIDSKKVAGELGNSSSFQVDPKHLKATGKLSAVSKATPTPFMTVMIDLAMDKFNIPNLDGFKLSKTTAQFRVTGDLPLDDAKGPLGSTLAMTMDVKAKGKPDPNLPEFDLVMTFTRNSRTTYAYGK